MKTRISRDFGLTALTIASVILLGGCMPEDKKDSTAEYNQLVKKYNDLAEKYNTQTQRNLDGDNSIQKASQELLDLDFAVQTYRTHLDSTYLKLKQNKCSEARSEIEGEVKTRLDQITTKSNILAQGTLSKALTRMQRDQTHLKEESRASVRVEIWLVQSKIDSGLTGIKSFALSAHNRLIDDYNESCLRERIEPKIDAGPATFPTATVPAVAHGIDKDSVVTVDRSGKREVITRDDMKTRYRGTYDEAAYNHFSEIATGSGGFVGFSPTAELFSQTVDIVLQNILDKSGRQTDVAIVLDTTSSMSDDIGNVKKNMKRLIAKLKEKSSDIGLRLSLVLYRDKGDDYITKIAADFTADLDAIDGAIQVVTVAGGGDMPEAVIDALDLTLNSLKWRDSASRSVVLIGDAPGHKSSHKGLSTLGLVDNYRRAGLGIIVYPILVSR